MPLRKSGRIVEIRDSVILSLIERFMAVFDVEFLTVLLSAFVISRIDPVVNLVKRVGAFLVFDVQLLSGLFIYLPPDQQYSDAALQPIPKNCEDKDAYMNNEIKEVPHVVVCAVRLTNRRSTRC